MDGVKVVRIKEGEKRTIVLTTKKITTKKKKKKEEEELNKYVKNDELK